jgi:hypothetical protein
MMFDGTYSKMRRDEYELVGTKTGFDEIECQLQKLAMSMNAHRTLKVRRQTHEFGNSQHYLQSHRTDGAPEGMRYSGHNSFEPL